MRIKFIYFFLFSVPFYFVGCNKKKDPFYNHAVILGFDRDTLCKNKLVIRLDTFATGYIAAGYTFKDSASDSKLCQVRNYPSTFKINQNTSFPINILLNYEVVNDPLSCRSSTIDIKEMVRSSQ